ncbi:amino acid permease [Lysinibacillus sphaericus]|uniref:Amino acid permease n=1 Tax=Lysinibacillus sphaericus TaxID=1421 RepID=A0A544UCJ0_LYSSH|nr:amino acid permease [Lysinibacillus sp. SDF0037]TQR30060.1 amino acid permease [Lysinibacillus sp. SDF0037]
MGALQKSLKTRHITMISIGGVIGTGLFVGTGKNILSTGPAAVISYAIACMLIVLIMQMVGEMASGEIVLGKKSGGSAELGSFASYAGKYIGPWAGFTVGWLYWASWVFIVGLEAALIGGMLHNWFPMIPTWLGSVGITLLMTIVNIYSVKSFGEFEYWLSFVKVTAIIVFLVVGIAMILGIWPNYEPKGLGILTEFGGFAPNGIVPIFTAIVFVIFSICGAEVAAIAAAESENPARNIVRAIRNVVFRLGLFFVGSVAIMVLIIPWNDSKILAAPYANILTMAGLPIAAQLIQIVIFISLISVLNSALYTSSRMLLEMSRQGDAPKIFSQIKNRRGVPVPAVIGSTVVAYICAMLYFISPEVIFYFLGNCVGGLMIAVYIFIAISQIRFRRYYDKVSDEPLSIRMWLFPYLSYVTIAILTVVYLCQALIESLRSQFYLSTFVLIGSVVLFVIMRKLSTRPAEQIEEKLASE